MNRNKLCACCYGTGYEGYSGRPVVFELEQKLAEILQERDRLRATTGELLARIRYAEAMEGVTIEQSICPACLSLVSRSDPKETKDEIGGNCGALTSTDSGEVE